MWEVMGAGIGFFGGEFARLRVVGAELLKMGVNYGAEILGSGAVE